jgi:DNA-binding GntR family transcriptional regulator
MDNSSISRSQRVHTTLKGFIRDGVLEPGQRVREAEIAEKLGVSRTPVREAINRLLSEGLLALTPIRGFAVAELDKQQVLEIYAVREFLEGAAARFAAQHASPLEIASLREMAEVSRTIPEDDPAEHARMNKQFHAMISEASHNRYLQPALTRLADSLALVRGTTFELEGRVEAVYREHLAILDAMEARDPDRAEAAARDHIRKAGEVRLKLLFGRY